MLASILFYLFHFLLLWFDYSKVKGTSGDEMVIKLDQ